MGARATKYRHGKQRPQLLPRQIGSDRTSKTAIGSTATNERGRVMYGYTKGLGDTISCDDCNEIAENWFVGEDRAICGNCYGVIV
jgi:hypothetical protein